jgi:hypothetical protein
MRGDGATLRKVLEVIQMDRIQQEGLSRTRKHVAKVAGGRLWIFMLAVILGLACSGETQPKAAAGLQAQSATPPLPATQPATEPRDSSCGPEIEGQADNVRVAVLEALIRQSLQKAESAAKPHGEIVIGEERRLPNGQVFIGDASPGVTAHFANHTPPVGSYSSAFYVQGTRTQRKKDRVAFTAGAICWKMGGEVVVKARTINNDGNTPWSATLQRTGADWQVKSIEARG